MANVSSSGIHLSVYNLTYQGPLGIPVRVGWWDVVLLDLAFQLLLAGKVNLKTNIALH